MGPKKAYEGGGLGAEGGGPLGGSFIGPEGGLGGLLGGGYPPSGGVKKAYKGVKMTVS